MSKRSREIDIKLVRRIRDNPGLPVVEVVRPLEDIRSQRRLYSCVKRLAEGQYISLTPRGRTLLCNVTPKGRKFLAAGGGDGP